MKEQILKQKYPEKEYKIATAKIRNCREINLYYKKRYDELGYRLEDAKSFISRRPIEEEREFIKNKIIQNEETIMFLNKKYFPDKER